LMNPRKFLYDFRGFSHHSIVPKATDFFAAFTILGIVPSVGHSVAQLRILVLNRAGAGAVVYDGKVGVGLRCGETHQPPAVVCRHVEPECSREIARVRVMETHERLAQTARIRIRESLAP